MKRNRRREMEPWQFIAGYLVCCLAVFGLLILLRILNLI